MEIKIAGFKVKIEEIKHLAIDYDHLGEYSSIKQEIRIDKDLTSQQKKKF